MANPAPGFDIHPGYQVKITPLQDEVTVEVNNQVIAHSKQAVLVEETKHKPVWYMPLADIDADVLQTSETSTYCPFKGQASYRSVAVAGETIEDAIWVYEKPFDECAAIAGYASFYTNKVQLKVAGQTIDNSGPGFQKTHESA
ncbi:MAG: DUF427 domain-containing protein [Pseudomonadaceae bacterium]|nr:DUF427 domain-containing protein [Pseudomonadaceae bacterium]